ncbi:MAG: response regulator transcription factor [Verrucomicrobiota bacterium]
MKKNIAAKLKRKDMRIRVAIVEDSRGTRESLTELLNHAPTLRCVGAHPSAEEALSQIPAETPDVVLMDINLPQMNGIECVAQLKQQMPKTQVLMLTTYEEGDLIFDSLRRGASGYLLKNMPPRELVEAIEEVHTGGAPMSPQIARKVVAHFQQIKKPQSDIEQLTKREQEILALLAKGYYYKEIAEQMGVTIHTVKAHSHHVYEKLHVQSRTEAVLRYLDRQ